MPWWCYLSWPHGSKINSSCGPTPNKRLYEHVHKVGTSFILLKIKGALIRRGVKEAADMYTYLVHMLMVLGLKKGR